MHAIVLAGTDVEADDLMKDKALLPLKGIPMIKFVIEALKESEHINKIFVVGEVDKLKPIIAKDVDNIIHHSDSIIKNINNGMKNSLGEERVLVVTCDLPLINVDIINKFIEAGLEKNIDVFYPIVDKGLYESIYPKMKRTYVYLKDGAFTGGNIIMIKPSVMKSIEKTTESLIKNRKNPFKMCRILGIAFLIKLIFKQLKLLDIEKTIKKRFRINGLAYICTYPEICSDLDHYEEVALFEEYL
ncbi:NTP transferase domain-containing protein [Alkaliphilus pronyensis]|uniref:NTP transferase domain-containing protein n=1 Tax=Alkaliphilus pronyensis TaxID=1482732 RepID=A0A6I0FDI5_9FIRM|nr:nucleotidyltransferase family protein [Alkaliphilus pronyensis]KAB3540961.1 NTP transferase domain-containing protein [Alkaliphilus pronyensis]